MWAPFSEPNVFSKTAADPMNALRAQGDTHATSAVYGNLF
jgi:aarF domain-containing kinase